MSVGTHTTPAEAHDDVPVDRFYRLSDDQYRRMVGAGILHDDSVELSGGVLRMRHPASSEPSDQFFRMSVEEYHEAARLGILTESDRVELLEGWLVAKVTKKPPHTIAKGLVQDELIRITPAGWYVVIEDPVSTPESEPEPDAMIVRGRRRDFRDRQPGPRDVALVVEVADSTLADDRRNKRRIYARAGIATYWIVNLIDGQVEVHTEPSGPAPSPGYSRREVFGPDAEIPVLLDGREVGRVAVQDVLP